MVNDNCPVLFPSHRESGLVLDVFKGGLQALKIKPYFYPSQRKLAQGELFASSFVLSTFKIKVFFVTCSRMLVKVCVQTCGFIITGSPAPVKQKASQKFSESENACALVFPDPPMGNLRALGREGPKPKPTPPMRSTPGAFVGTSLQICSEEDTGKPESSMRFAPM